MSRARLLELLLLVAAAAALAAAVPLSTGYFAWSWDALNHHVYLGMLAEHPRWHLDVAAANTQSYQYPYLYWPAYRISLLSGSGAWTGALWSALQAVLVLVPVWFISLRLLPPVQSAWQGVAQRTAACALAFMNAVVLIGLETTASDVLAAVPLLWAVYAGLSTRPDHRQALTCGALWGLSVACKLSNGLFLPLLLFWWWQPRKPHLALARGACIAAGACLGFAVPYAPWGWRLWQLTGNPLYPFAAQWFGS
jgi:Gpi18-like mannosyltransferase